MADEPDEAEVVFAFSPALAVQGLLDFTKSEHSKIYKSAIREVCKEPFDCEAEGLFQFLKDVQDRADEMGWSDGILNITLEVTDDNEPVQERLIENYGTISLEKVTESELQYINEQGREAQDTYMLYKCLMASLTNAAKKRISLWSDQYRIGDNDLCSGVALLKIIIRESHLDTNATTNQIRTKLSNLDSYILTVDSDIGKFNQYVKLLLQSLTARNQKTSDLLINLFKGYGAVSDEVFRAWLMRKQDDHEEGEELTPDDLMIAAKNKYDTMVEKGTWNAPTAEEKIVALEAKFNSTMKSLNKKVSHESSKKKKAAKSGGDKQSSKKKEGDHPKKWKAPKPGDKKEVDFQGHMWYWCGKDTGGKCEKWRAHKPKECKGLAADAAGDKRKRESTGSDKKKAIEKKLKVAKAYVAKMEQSVEKDTTEDEDSE
ncbi:hypothetical protein MHU86_17083 [Fragilaria crotonensis]|nr:hypothetical protein MHU86_17083 [Fragilaria crotonensis]